MRKEKTGRRAFDWLLCSNFLLVTFLGKHFVEPPGGLLDFVLKVVGSFLVGAIITALIRWSLPKNALKFVIPVNFVLAIILAVI